MLDCIKADPKSHDGWEVIDVETKNTLGVGKTVELAWMHAAVDAWKKLKIIEGFAGQ